MASTSLVSAARIKRCVTRESGHLAVHGFCPSQKAAMDEGGLRVDREVRVSELLGDERRVAMWSDAVW